MVDFQILFNIAFGFIMTMFGYFLRVAWDLLQKLQQQDRELAEKVGKIEVLVAGEYVRKDDFDRIIERLFDKLDHIELKIDSKADK